MLCAVNMQMDSRLSCAQVVQATDKVIRIPVSCAVMKVSTMILRRRGLEGLQPGQERGDTDSSCHPYLPTVWVPTAELKAAVGTLYAHRLSNLNLMPDAACKVSERLDAESNALVAPVGAGNSKGVGAF